MFRPILSWLVENQAALFGLAAGAVALVVIGIYDRRLFDALPGVGGGGFGAPWVKNVAPARSGSGSAVSALKGVAVLAFLAIAAYAGSAWAPEPISGTVLGLPPLTCGGQSRHLVLFLHGWRGDRDTSWRDYPNLVCGDREIADVDVLSIGYPTLLVGNNLSMGGFSKWLADELVANNIARYNHIAIVAHSIGGLIARGIVLEQRPELKSVGLLIEMASPHDGPREYTQLVRLGIAPGFRLVEELRSGSHYLTTERADWDALSPRPLDECWWSAGDQLVSEASAHDGCDPKHTHVLPTFDHRELVKPSTRDDDRYRIPMYFVKAYM